MSRDGGPVSATLSVFDRLIDTEPEMRHELTQNRVQSVRAVRASLRRDLEWLLNSRRIAVEPPESMKEVNRSLYMYGLPDLATFTLSSQKDRSRLLRLLKTTLRVFEPRLANVQVVPLDEADPRRQTIAFRIEGLLLMDPAPEHVSFDTMLEVSRGEYRVKGEPDAG